VIALFVARLVDFARRHAVAIVTGVLAATVATGFFTAGHLAINTDIEQMLPRDQDWRQHEIALDQAFPQNANLLAIVVDGATPEAADGAADALAARLRAQPGLFRHVRRPDGGAFFERNGLLFLPIDELQSVAQQLISAQPVIGSLAQDPSLRGLFGALTLFLQGIGRGDVGIDKLDPTLTVIATAVAGTIDGTGTPLSWGEMLTGAKPDPHELRRFVVTQPVLDFSALEPGAKATAEIRRLAGELGLTPQTGVRIRITGPVALGDEQFATLREGALRSTLLSVVSVCVILFVALRSIKLVVAILVTLGCGLVLTAGFAAVAIGSLNLISIAFAVLFIGLAVDFSIQFSIRYRDQRHRLGTIEAALPAAGGSIGPALILAAGATSIGFFAFVPTAYVGVRELGWIAGAGMLIAIALNFVLLPGLLSLSRPRAEREAIGFRHAAPLDRLLSRHRAAVISLAALIAAAGLYLLPRVHFDFDPLNLKDPNSESVATVFDLMKDPTTSPYTAEIIAPSLDAAARLAARLENSPEVAQTVTAGSYIPADQDEKLAIIGDLSLLLGPTLTPVNTLPPPSDAEVMAAMEGCRAALLKIAASSPQGPSGRLARALTDAIGRGPGIVPQLRRALLSGLNERLAMLAKLTQAQPVTLASLPDDLRADWITPDGRARVEVFPRGDARDNAVLERFVAAVRIVAPEATGSPVTIQESGRLISTAFVHAGAIAVAAITVLLAIILRRARDVFLVIAPLLLAAIMTLAITVLIGMRLNYANIIALPLLLGIGVAFDIYFVMNWRIGVSEHLQSSTARAVVFSALTTMSAFGSLAVSNDPGTAEMGKLLSISLACTLFCTLIVLPALLGPARREALSAGSELFPLPPTGGRGKGEGGQSG